MLIKIFILLTMEHLKPWLSTLLFSWSCTIRFSAFSQFGTSTFFCVPPLVFFFLHLSISLFFLFHLFLFVS